MKNVEKAIEILNKGGIIIFPTDTAYGIGCRMDRPEAVDRLFVIRKRPAIQATPVLVSSEEMALACWKDPPEIVRHLMSEYWPGGLTIIARAKKDEIHSPIRGGGDAIGLRMPDHPLTLEIIRRIGVGLLGPSANFHGEKTPYTETDLDPELVKLVDFVVPGQTKGTLVSTVVDCTVTPPVIRRQGAVKISGMKDINKAHILLSINTSKRDEVVLSLAIEGEHTEIKKKLTSRSSQEVLPLLEELCRERNISIRDVTGIEVNTGPGSFTGLRVGASIGNALSWVLGIPINGMPPGSLTDLIYEGDKFR